MKTGTGRTRIGALSLCLLTCAACSPARPLPAPCPDPPAGLLLETAPPKAPRLEQNLDLLLYLLDLQSRLESCNADKTALRAWHAGPQAE